MTLSKEIFRVDNVLAGKVPVGDDQCRFDFNIFETKVKELIEQRLGDKNHIISKSSKDHPQCHTFVVAKMAGNINALPTIFRSYYAEGVPKSKCAIWEAARATTAAPSFFKPMAIPNPQPPITYVDGGLGYNNPSQLAMVEAQRIWGTGRKFCIVSIGTGQQSAKSIVDESQLETNLETQRSIFKTVQSSLSGAMSKLPYWDTAKNIPRGVLALLKMANALISVVTYTEAVHDMLQRDSDQQYPYFRFNVERDVGDIGLEDWKKVHALTTYTTAYMTIFESEKRKNMCAKCLIQPSVFYRKSQFCHKFESL
jgi:predicted acylesterase/phospholipase RssA